MYAYAYYQNEELETLIHMIVVNCRCSVGLEMR